jgi:hypothetical protein
MEISVGADTPMSDRRLNRLELEERAQQRLAELVPEALERLEEIAASRDGPNAREAPKLLRQYEPALLKVPPPGLHTTPTADACFAI